MHNPGPPLLRTTRALLTLAHLVGAASVFLPFIEGISPWTVVTEMSGEVAQDPGLLRSDLFDILLWFSLALPFVAGPYIWLLQLRAWLPAPHHRFEIRLARTAAVAMIAVSLTLHGLIVRQSVEDGLGSDAGVISAIFSVGGLGVLALFGYAWRRRRRPLHAPAAPLLGLRFAYLLGVAAPLIIFGSEGIDALDAGGWCALGACALYLFEAIVLYAGGRRHASGSTTSTALRYWLPTPDADPGRDSPVCAACGYDLRGTLAAGILLCPECGTAAASKVQENGV